MVTPELLEYIRTEVSKGKTREEIHVELISKGGWNESDLSEAFRIVIPMQNNVVLPNPVVYKQPLPTSSYEPLVSFFKPTPLPESLASSHSYFWQNLIFIILGLFCIVSWYFYRPQITMFWNLGVKSSQEFSVNSWNSLEKFSVNSWNLYANIFKKTSFPALALPSFKLPSFSFKLPSFDFGKIFSTNKAQVLNSTVVKNTVKETANIIKDCGMGVTPKLDNPSTYDNDPVLSCLGASALNCENARGILADDFFPTIFEIIKVQDSCNFKLSYSTDSTLTDITGNKLAGQYISCPVNIVKSLDNTDSTNSKFISPDKTNFSKYASQIYFYGTLGLFLENNLKQNKIQALGCEGKYIQSIIASYSLSQQN